MRRPEGRRSSLFLSIAVLPALLLLGGGHGADPPRVLASVQTTFAVEGLLADRAASGGHPGDSLAYWVFFAAPAAGHLSSPFPTHRLPGRVRATSRWLNAVSVRIPGEDVRLLERIPGVERVQRVRRLSTGGARVSPVGLSSGLDPLGVQIDSSYGGLSAAMATLEIPQVHALGFLGTGTRIGVLDGAFRPEHRAVTANPPLAERDFIDGDLSVRPDEGDPLASASHGTGLWSVVAGDWPGTIRGPAPSAGVLLARVVDPDQPDGADEDRWVAGLEWLESQGARIVLSGVGFRNFGTGYSPEDLNGDVAPATLAADEAARRGVLVVSPVGNGGPQVETLESPSDGDSVLAVGSVDEAGFPSAFSAQGPTSDGRPKPDLLAPGEGLLAATAGGLQSVAVVQGTEFASALLAGAAALFVEAYPERGPMAVLEALRASAQTRSSAFFRVPRVAPAILFPDGVAALPSEDVGAGGVVSTLTPRFRWNVPTLHPLGLPTTFRLELAEDSLFQGPILADSVIGTFARRIQEPLPPRSRLFWRVTAVSAQGISWATAPRGPVVTPSWVALEVLNDPGGSEINDAQPEFSWTPMPLSPPSGPFSFELQILDDRENEVLQSYPGLETTTFEIAEPLPFNVTLRWRVLAEARTGAVDTVTSAGPFVVTGGDNPPVTILYQNFPNPFPNPDEGIWTTRIWFDLAEESAVELAVYDMRGRLVRTLIPGGGCGQVRLVPGLYGREGGADSDPCTAFAWDGKDQSGSEVQPGVYLLRLRAGGVVSVRRVVFWP